MKNVRCFGWFVMLAHLSDLQVGHFWDACFQNVVCRFLDPAFEPEKTRGKNKLIRYLNCQKNKSNYSRNNCCKYKCNFDKFLCLTSIAKFLMALLYTTIKTELEIGSNTEFAI